MMEEYKKGGVSDIISPRNSKTPNVKGKGRRSETYPKTNSLKKNVRFECSSAEKEHIKYVPTPFSSGAKKKEKAKITKEIIGNKKKLSFDEDEATYEKPEKKRAKKRKLQNEQTHMTEINGNDLSETRKKKSKKMKKAIDSINKTEDSVEVPKKGKKKKENEPTECSADNTGSKNENTIFVGNLPISYDHKKVMKVFSKFGKVKSARIRCVPVPSLNVSKKVSAITKKFHPSRNSVSAFVVFHSQDSVAKAVAENGMLINGHHLRIDYAEKKKMDLNKAVFVGGLPLDMEDDELWEAFKDCGEIDSVRIIRDRNIGIGKGFGYVNFKSLASVELALKLNGQEIKNRKINVERGVLRKKKFKKSGSKFQMKNNMKNKMGNKKSFPLSPDAPSSESFQGRKAEQKQKKKKKKKTTGEAVRKNKIKSLLTTSKKQEADKKKGKKAQIS